MASSFFAVTILLLARDVHVAAKRMEDATISGAFDGAIVSLTTSSSVVLKTLLQASRPIMILSQTQISWTSHPTHYMQTASNTLRSPLNHAKVQEVQLKGERRYVIDALLKLSHDRCLRELRHMWSWFWWPNILFGFPGLGLRTRYFWLCPGGWNASWRWQCKLCGESSSQVLSAWNVHDTIIVHKLFKERGISQCSLHLKGRCVDPGTNTNQSRWLLHTRQWDSLTPRYVSQISDETNCVLITNVTCKSKGHALMIADWQLVKFRFQSST